jgi:hypothetical protein
MERSTTFDIMDQESEDQLLEFIGSFALGMWENRNP